MVSLPLCPPKSPALLTFCTSFKVLNNSLAEWPECLRGIIRAPWMWACSFQRGVGRRLTAIKNFEICACGYNVFFPRVPQKSVETGMFVCVCAPMRIRHMQSVPEAHESVRLSHTWIPRCGRVTSHLHWLPEGAAVGQAIFVEGTQVTATPVINDIALSSTPVWAHCGALEGL